MDKVEFLRVVTDARFSCFLSQAGVLERVAELDAYCFLLKRPEWMVEPYAVAAAVPDKLRTLLVDVVRVPDEHVDRVERQVRALQKFSGALNVFCVYEDGSLDCAVIPRGQMEDARAEVEGGGDAQRPLADAEVGPVASWLEMVANAGTHPAYEVRHALVVGRAVLEGRDGARAACDAFTTPAMIGQLRRGNDDGMRRALRMLREQDHDSEARAEASA